MTLVVGAPGVGIEVSSCATTLLLEQSHALRLEAAFVQWKFL